MLAERLAVALISGGPRWASARHIARASGDPVAVASSMRWVRPSTRSRSPIASSNIIRNSTAQSSASSGVVPRFSSTFQFCIRASSESNCAPSPWTSRSHDKSAATSSPKLSAVASTSAGAPNSAISRRMSAVVIPSGRALRHRLSLVTRLAVCGESSTASSSNKPGSGCGTRAAARGGATTSIAGASNEGTTLRRRSDACAWTPVT